MDVFYCSQSAQVLLSSVAGLICTAEVRCLWQQAEPTVDVDVEQLLDHKLEQMPGMTLGQLDNGLRYVILPNKVPPNRFGAHLEMHVGETVMRLPVLSWSMRTSA